MMDYRPPLWLPGGHLQTVYPAKVAPKPRVTYRRERWDVHAQDDFIDVDFVDGQPGMPCVVLFHGLEGSSDSHYARALMAALAVRGWSGAVPHFRGCSGEPNRAPRFYHSGDAAEIDWILRRLRPRVTGPLFVAGVSLGGNALLRWLGESQHGADWVAAACAISAPLDLVRGGAALSSGVNMLYTRMFLQTLKPKCLAKLDQFPGLFDRDALLQARDLYAFDNIVTAPLHGYRDTDGLLGPRQRAPRPARHHGADAGAERPQRSIFAGRTFAGQRVGGRHAGLSRAGRPRRFQRRWHQQLAGAAHARVLRSLPPCATVAANLPSSVAWMTS